MIDEGGVIVVDVREADEYATGHIPNSILLPLDSIISKANIILPDRWLASIPEYRIWIFLIVLKHQIHQYQAGKYQVQ